MTRICGEEFLEIRHWWYSSVDRIRPCGLRGAKETREKSLLVRRQERPLIRSKLGPSASGHSNSAAVRIDE